MEKLIIGASFTFGLLIAIPSMADTGKSCDSPGSCNYTPQSNAGSGIGSSPAGALPPGWTPGGGMGGGPSAQDLQAKKRAEEEGIRAGCRANQGGITYRYELCVNGAINKLADNVRGCPPETDVTTTINPVVGSVSASTSPNASCVTALKIDYERDVSNCAKTTGLTQCKAYGAF